MAKQEGTYVNAYHGQKWNENAYCEPIGTNGQFNQETCFSTLQSQPLAQVSRNSVIKCQGNCNEVYEDFILTREWRKNDNGLHYFFT